MIYEFLIIFLAKYLGWVLGLGLAASLIRANSSRIMVIEAFLSGAVARFGFTEIIRYFYNRPRPFEVKDITPLISHDPGGSFPSGNATFFFAFATTLLFYDRRWGAVFFVGAILMGAARVLAGVHWPSDILGGAAVGVLTSCIVNFLLKNYWKSDVHLYTEIRKHFSRNL
ncbi:phosphatase PAP2 family protein [Candidatus Giovannonibacteria bacterium]|nr:phosphatase PAP2 family protein [Candidatus Giovannonibacteria bacterium]